jgi:hypothetical protein
MSETDWLLEHAEVTAATPAFAWAHMTDVANWDDPPARVQLEGAFAAGSAGQTLFPDRPPLRWRVEEVVAGSAYTIAAELEGAVLLCHWRFEGMAVAGTRLTQRIGLRGPEAKRHADAVRAGFGAGLAAGMKRIAERIAAAASSAS